MRSRVGFIRELLEAELGFYQRTIRGGVGNLLESCYKLLEAELGFIRELSEVDLPENC